MLFTYSGSQSIDNIMQSKVCMILRRSGYIETLNILDLAYVIGVHTPITKFSADRLHSVAEAALVTNTGNVVDTL